MLLFLGMLIILFIFFLFYTLIKYRSTSQVNSLINQKFPEDFDYDLIDHDAFIIIHSEGDSGNQYAGLDNLIVHFKSNRFHFVIYHCFNPEDVKQILRKKTAKYIWIFGHGWRGGIAFKLKRSLSEKIRCQKKKIAFEYVELKKEIDSYPRKSFIGQFHCNHIEEKYDNTPLPSILLEDNPDSGYFLTNSTLSDCSVWFAIRELLKDIKRPGV